MGALLATTRNQVTKYHGIDVRYQTRKSASKVNGRYKKAAFLLKRLAMYSLVLISGLLICFFAVTDISPETKAISAPTAQQVGAGRDAMRQVSPSITVTGPRTLVRLRPDHLDGLSALASHAFHPDRLNLSVKDRALHIHASHETLLGRWLNVSAVATEQATGLPDFRATVGPISFSPYFTHLLIKSSRSVGRLLGLDIPLPSELLRQFRVEGSEVVAYVNTTYARNFATRVIGGNDELNVDLLTRAYCSLARAQAADPQNDFAIQVRRAFPIDQAGQITPEKNRAALVALAMAVVGKEVGHLANIAPSTIAACTMPNIQIELHGRSDLPKHWALSAALQVLGGSQIAQAIGEWKELSDTLSSKSEFQPGSPTGFSFVDIAANRSGLRAAYAANDAKSAEMMAARMSVANRDDILPPSLLIIQENSALDFGNTYGDIADPRFVAAILQIDKVLYREGLTRGIR